MLKMKFPARNGRGSIEVEVDCNGNGEAYFRGDDFLADVCDGLFTHPMLGIEYRVLLPIPARNGGKASLETRVWRAVDTAVVFDATPGT